MPKHPLSQIIEQGQFFHVYLLSAEDPTSLATELQMILADIQDLNGHKSLDMHHLQAEEGTIDVESVKNFRQIFSLQAVSKIRVGVIEHIEQMTVPAQQMLLKLLEEAPLRSIFFLTTSRLKSISKPILSRTAVFRLGTKPYPLKPEYRAWFDTLFASKTLLVDKQVLIDQIDKESTWNEVSLEMSHYIQKAHLGPNTIQKWLFTLSLAQPSTKVKVLLEYFFLT